MSNVLIGIIGVILFIGLALAGALFLGPRFQESTRMSKAAASVQAMKQIADAANLHRIQEGHAAQGGSTSSLAGYLRTVPSNPTGGCPPGLHAADSTYNGNAVFSVMEIRDDGVCEAINRQLGVSGTVTSLPDYPSWQAGCYRQSAQRGSNGPGVNVGFVRI